MIGEKNPRWKGIRVGYKCLHKWVRRHKGLPGKCLHCNEDKKRRVWANLSGKYSRDLNDWIPLCYSCHFKFDHKESWGQHKYRVTWNKGITGYTTSLKGRKLSMKHREKLRTAANIRWSKGISKIIKNVL